MNFLFLPFIAVLGAEPADFKIWNLGQQIFHHTQPAQVQLKALPAVAPHQQANPNLSEKCQALLTQVIGNAGDLDSRQILWQDFKVLDYPILLNVPQDAALLVGHPDPPSAYVPYQDAHLPPGLPMAVLEGGLSDAPTMDFDYPVNGRPVFLYEVDEQADGVFRTVVHERFHIYQKDWKPLLMALPGDWQEPYPVENVENLAMATLEQKVLADALSAATPLGIRESIRNFAAVRQKRLNLIPTSAYVLELSEERSEGTARYVEALADEEIYGNNAREQIAFMLRTKLGVEQLQKWRFYATGAGMALLLDKKGILWKNKVENGLSPWQVLRSNTPIDDSEVERRAQLMKQRYHYDWLLANAKELVEKYKTEKEKAWQDFINAPGYRLKVHFEGPPGFRNSGGKIYQLPEGWFIVHPNELVVSSLNTRLELHDRSVLNGPDASSETYH
ncbi:MAG: hypothetical protein HY747_01430 [Elusimicrobia bacterium]|nr:hypothetical protein [Elusimicrobiota bacterium]